MDKAAIYDIVDTSSGPKCIYICLCTIKLPEIRKHKADKTEQNSLDTADFCMLRLSTIAHSFNIWTLQQHWYAQYQPLVSLSHQHTARESSGTCLRSAQQCEYALPRLPEISEIRTPFIFQTHSGGPYSVCITCDIMYIMYCMVAMNPYDQIHMQSVKPVLHPLLTNCACV